MLVMTAAVPVLTPEAMTEQGLVLMAMPALLRSAEKAACLVLVQKVEHVFPGGEDIAHAGHGMGIHDGSRHVLVGGGQT